MTALSTPIVPKPQLVFHGLPDMPALWRLRDHASWVTWRYIWKANPSLPGGGKWDKPPFDPRTDNFASVSNEKTWGSYDEAVKAARIYPETGVGFVLTATDGFSGIDLDKCRNPKTGELDAWAQEIIDLGETYCEVSPSGCGVRMFALGKIDAALKYDPAHVEAYGVGRYLTVTGRHIEGTPTEMHPAPKTLAALKARVEAMKPKPASPPASVVRISDHHDFNNAGRLSGQTEGKSPFFRNVNDAALADLGAWFGLIFPRAAFQPGTNGYRVSSNDLGRRLEEDLSATPMGIVDFGIHDMGDARGGKRSAIDIVIEFGSAPSEIDAAKWLCDRLGRTPEYFGWRTKAAQSLASGVPEGFGPHNPALGVVAAAAKPAPAAPAIKASPFVWREPSLFPKRRWLYGHDYARRYVSALIAPGGTGKSSLLVVEALALVTGRDLLGVRPREQVNVWYWGGEDPLEETERRVIAAMKHYGIAPVEVDGRLFIDSGRDTPIIIGSSGKDGVQIASPVVDSLVANMLEREIGALLVDPFISSHRVNENANGEVDAVAKQWGLVAERANAAVGLAHHARKPGGAEVTTETSRGASSLMDAARMGRAINRMSQAQADEAGLESPNGFFRIGGADPGKQNMAPPPDKTKWYRLVSVPLGNGRQGESAFANANRDPDDDGDHVAVVDQWEWPSSLSAVNVAHLDEVQRRVGADKYRDHYSSPDYVGHLVADVLDLDIDNQGHRARIRKQLATWYKSGALEVYEAKDANREIKKFVRRGTGEAGVP